MSDTKSGDDHTLTVHPKKTLTLKRPGLEQGTVRQNFSHGRTKQVVVETKKRKFSMPGERAETPPAQPVIAPRPQPAPAAAPAPDANLVAAGQPAPVADGIPHLSSPENLPPGTSDQPVSTDSPNVTYLKELWHAIQTQEISRGDALLALTQRPLNTPVTNDPSLGTPPGDPNAPAPAPADTAPAPAPELVPAPAPAQ